jgi:predicted nuclease of predicted toxin-antitoxin system
VRLKLDENLGLSARAQLQAGGHDVDTVLDEGLAGAPDDDVFQRSSSDERILVTLDLDFANPMRFEPAAGSGVVVLRVPTRPSRGDIRTVLDRLVSALGTADPSGRLWVVDDRRVRQFQPPADDG